MDRLILVKGLSSLWHLHVARFYFYPDIDYLRIIYYSPSVSEDHYPLSSYNDKNFKLDKLKIETFIQTIGQINLTLHFSVGSYSAAIIVIPFWKHIELKIVLIP